MDEANCKRFGVYVLVKTTAAADVRSRYKQLVQSGKAAVAALYFNRHGVKTATQYRMKE